MLRLNEYSKEQENLCVVRLTTTFWKNERGIFSKKSLTFLKRRCVGYNVLEEDCSAVGAEEVMPKIVNLNEVVDGIYVVVTCNESRDYETGCIDDYDYRLVPE